MDNYQIDGSSTDKITIDGVSYSVWKVVKNGQMIAALVGPGSASIALAAAERLNNNPTKWNWYGWTERLHNLFVEKAV
jgi:hypothetical protein